MKTTYKIVNQLLNKVHCSNIQNHTNEKTLANSFKLFYTNKVKSTRESFKKSSLTPECQTMKQLIKHALEYFTEVIDDDIINPMLTFQIVSPCDPTKFKFLL